jgi:hypothetical protein
MTIWGRCLGVLSAITLFTVFNSFVSAAKPKPCVQNAMQQTQAMVTDLRSALEDMGDSTAIPAMVLAYAGIDDTTVAVAFDKLRIIAEPRAQDIFFDLLAGSDEVQCRTWIQVLWDKMLELDCLDMAAVLIKKNMQLDHEFGLIDIWSYIFYQTAKHNCRTFLFLLIEHLGKRMTGRLFADAIWGAAYAGNVQLVLDLISALSDFNLRLEQHDTIDALGVFLIRMAAHGRYTVVLHLITRVNTLVADDLLVAAVKRAQEERHQAVVAILLQEVERRRLRL